MKMTGILRTATATLTITILALGLAMRGHWWPAAASAALGAVWFYGRQRRLGWYVYGALGVMFTAAFGYLLEAFSLHWALVINVLALCTWDLDDFQLRLSAAPRVASRHVLARAHIWRVFVVTLSGLALAAIAMTLSIDLGFWLALSLGLLAMLGLGGILLRRPFK